MKIIACGDVPTVLAPDSYFTGRVTQNPIIETEAPARLRATTVTFDRAPIELTRRPKSIVTRLAGERKLGAGQDSRQATRYGSRRAKSTGTALAPRPRWFTLPCRRPSTALRSNGWKKLATSNMAARADPTFYKSSARHCCRATFDFRMIDGSGQRGGEALDAAAGLLQQALRSGVGDAEVGAKPKSRRRTPPPHLPPPAAPAERSRRSRSTLPGGVFLPISSRAGRVDVEGSLGRRAGDAARLVEHRHHQVATALEDRLVPWRRNPAVR